MNYLKLSLLTLSLTVPLIANPLNLSPAHSTPIIAQTQTPYAHQLFAKGVDCFQKEQWDLAIFYFSQSIAQDPSIPYNYVGRATATILNTPEPTIPILNAIEKDLRTALSLLSPTEDPDTYQYTRNLLQQVTELRTSLGR